MVILQSVDSLLAHIQEVQDDVMELSKESLMKMSSYIEDHKLDIDDNISTSLQYQDIITQQLSASIEAIGSMRKSLERFSHAFSNDESLVQDSMVKLEEKLNKTLAEAKDKKNRFSGKVSQTSDTGDEIEFF